MVTSDIWFASYLLFKGYSVSSFEVTGKGKGTYTFNIDNATWKELKLEFQGSETSAIKAHHISLKDLLY